LALHFGIYVANYPFTEDDLDHPALPEFLAKRRGKLFGLTIEPARLHAIREERRPNSRYASLSQCETEVKTMQSLLKREKIPFLNATSYSIEEISTRILAHFEIERKLV